MIKEMADVEFDNSLYIKFDDLQEEYKPLVEFACMVCQARHRSSNYKYSGCALRNVRKEYCAEIGAVIQSMRRNEK